MKISLFLATLVGLAFTVSLGGCTTGSEESPSVSHKQASSQSPSSQRTETISSASQKTTTAISVSPKKKVIAAIMLPLSGPNAALGQAMLNAAQQAVFDSAGDNFELQPRDTTGGAEQAARLAIANGAQIIIGPLFAADVPVVENVVLGQGLPILPLSTDTSLSQPYVYVMGLAPGAQVKRVVNYAVSHGARRFAALVPSTPYGILVEQEFRNAVMQRPEARLIDVESFTSTAEIPDRVKKLAAQHDNIDAVFLPESGDVLKTAADQLAFAGFDTTHTHILGTGLWDVPGLGHLSPLLLGGWYAAPDPALRHSFIDNYKAAYGQEPPRLATLAYDATALAAVIAKRGGRYDEVALTNPNGFAGLDGIFRLLPSGVVERAMAVNEVAADGAHVVDPAPTSFAR